MEGDLSKGPHHRPVSCVVTEETGYATSGRPKKGSVPGILGYRISGEIEKDETAIQGTLSRKGVFVVATNVLDGDIVPARDLVVPYKSQGTLLEAGFRLFKLCSVNSRGSFLFSFLEFRLFERMVGKLPGSVKHGE